MKTLLQVIYISRSTFEALDANNKIEPNIARILAKSRVNNRINGLVGVLYFGDGVFFQCLEGEENAIKTLMIKLKADSRHKDLKIISKKTIQQLTFGDWAMKFAPLDAQIQQFLKENSFQKFDPYQFSGETINQFLNLLFKTHDVATDSVQLPTLNSVINDEQTYLKAIKTAQLKSNIALAVSIIALVLAAIAMFGNL